MRHFRLQALAVMALAGSMFVAPREAGLIAVTSQTLGLCPGLVGAAIEAIDIAAVTTTTDHYLTMAAGAVVETSTVLHRHNPSDKNYAWAGRGPTTARYCAADRV